MCLYYTEGEKIKGFQIQRVPQLLFFKIILVDVMEGMVGKGVKPPCIILFVESV